MTKQSTIRPCQKTLRSGTVVAICNDGAILYEMLANDDRVVFRSYNTIINAIGIVIAYYMSKHFVLYALCILGTGDVAWINARYIDAIG